MRTGTLDNRQASRIPLICARVALGMQIKISSARVSDAISGQLSNSARNRDVINFASPLFRIVIDHRYWAALRGRIESQFFQQRHASIAGADNHDTLARFCCGNLPRPQDAFPKCSPPHKSCRNAQSTRNTQRNPIRENRHSTKTRTECCWQKLPRYGNKVEQTRVTKRAPVESGDDSRPDAQHDQSRESEAQRSGVPLPASPIG